MMKKVLVSLTIGAIAAVGISQFINQPERQYVPKENAKEAFEARGAWEYLNKMRANQITGEIDPNDVANARAAVATMARNKTSNLNLSWEFVGPDNLGGRTRDFIIDRNNSNVLYAAGVAGGIFKSTTGGTSWTKVSSDLDNIAVVALTQAANGDIYAGTGEGGFAPVNGAGTANSPGMTGNGMYKSTDGGTTWSQLSATSTWTWVGALGTDPTNANRIYAGTNLGFRRSDDGGQTWSSPFSNTVASGSCKDLTVGQDGSVWASVADRIIYSANGDDNNWSEVSKRKLLTAPGELPRNGGRNLIAISSQNQDVVYCLQSANQTGMRAMYRSTNRGASWTVIGEPTAIWDPVCDFSGSAAGCISDWARLLQVDPQDDGHIFVGGLRLWEWRQTGGWRRVDGFGPFYVHADKHRMRFDPNNSNIVYVLTDGGIGKSSDNGYTWGVFNKDYRTGQFYHIGIGADRTVTGGTQDNGSWIINGQGNTPQTGFTVGGIAYQNGGFHAGDGGYSLISWLDDDIYFTSYQYGTIGRSENQGQSYSSFWDSRQLTTCRPWYGNNCSFSSWMVPYELHETTNDPLSTDSVLFVNAPAIQSLGFGGGDTSFASTINRPQSSATFLPATFRVESGSLVITSDASGNLSGSGKGFFDAATGNYSITFNTVPFAEIIVTCEVSYQAGSVVSMKSLTNGLPYNYTLPTSLNTGDTLKVQDPVQSMFLVGLNGTVWMTRKALDFSELPEWYLLANIAGTAQCVAISDDGNNAWVGTENGRLYRIDNLNLARSIETGDITSTNTVLVTSQQVSNFGGRNVTSVSVDPNNPDRVLVTVGNYGNNTYVYYSNNATSANPSFVSKQGNLPAFPVYSCTFDKGNPDIAIIGTEYGIYATDNIDAAVVSWTDENNGFSPTPVFRLVQYRTDQNSTADNTVMEGDIYLGSHGSSIWKTNTLQTTRSIGIAEEEKNTNGNASREMLNVYPNPATDFTNISFALQQSNDVVVSVRDMSGRLVNQMKFNRLSSGNRTIRINTADLKSGAYIINISAGAEVKSGKLIIAR